MILTQLMPRVSLQLFFISLIVGRKIDKRDAYWIVYGLVTTDFLCFVAKMDQILT